jgi:phospholipid/cholesterol/gamma-HCH transport system substrate-binding protein
MPVGRTPVPPARRRRIGAAVLLAIVLATYLGIAKPDPFAHREVVQAMFDHVQDMALVQRDVRVAGVNVGTIGAVRRTGAHAEVALVLNRPIPIYRDATATLRPHTPFEGTTFVDLDPGTPGAGRLGNRPISMAQTHVFVSVGDVLSTFTPPVRHGFQVIVAELARALASPGRRGISALLHDAPALSRQAAVVAPAIRGPHRRELRELIGPLAATVDALAGQDDQLRRVVHGAARTLDAVAADGGRELDASLRALPVALSNSRMAAHRVLGVIDRAQGTAGALLPTLRQVPPTLDAYVPLLRRADPVLRALPPYIERFAGTLSDFGRAAPALGRLFATVAPAAQLLSGSVLPFLNARSALGLPRYMQLIGAMAGYTGGLSSFVTKAQTTYAFPPVPLGHALRGTVQLPLTLPLEGLNAPLPCSAVAALNQSAASFVEALGLCTP